MTGPVGKSIVRALLDPVPSRPSKWWDANDSVTERGNEVADMRVELADLRAERAQLLAANVRLSAELASVTIERDELRAGVEDLHERLDSAARQRNVAKYWVGR